MSQQPPAPRPTSGSVGTIRNPVIVILLSIITLGIYALYWTYKTYEEMKDHSGEGLGGLVGLLLAIFCNIVTWFVLPSEVEKLYTRDGKTSPVSAVWGLWWLLPLIGAIIWFLKVQGALNDYWESKGATAS